MAPPPTACPPCLPPYRGGSGLRKPASATCARPTSALCAAGACPVFVPHEPVCCPCTSPPPRLRGRRRLPPQRRVGRKPPRTCAGSAWPQPTLGGPGRCNRGGLSCVLRVVDVARRPRAGPKAIAAAAPRGASKRAASRPSPQPWRWWGWRPAASGRQDRAARSAAGVGASGGKSCDEHKGPPGCTTTEGPLPHQPPLSVSITYTTCVPNTNTSSMVAVCMHPCCCAPATPALCRHAA